MGVSASPGWQIGLARLASFPAARGLRRTVGGGWLAGGDADGWLAMGWRAVLRGDLAPGPGMVKKNVLNQILELFCRVFGGAAALTGASGGGIWAKMKAGNMNGLHEMDD
ncbi:MAG: hypothetical protein AB7S99_13385 [Pseudodonghicola sp.]